MLLTVSMRPRIPRNSIHFGLIFVMVQLPHHHPKTRTVSFLQIDSLPFLNHLSYYGSEIKILRQDPPHNEINALLTLLTAQGLACNSWNMFCSLYYFKFLYRQDSAFSVECSEFSRRQTTLSNLSLHRLSVPRSAQPPLSTRNIGIPNVCNVVDKPVIRRVTKYRIQDWLLRCFLGIVEEHPGVAL